MAFSASSPPLFHNGMPALSQSAWISNCVACNAMPAHTSDNNTACTRRRHDDGSVSRPMKVSTPTLSPTARPTKPLVSARTRASSACRYVEKNSRISAPSRVTAQITATVMQARSARGVARSRHASSVSSNSSETQIRYCSSEFSSS